MKERIAKILAGVAVLAALAVGAGAIAQAGDSTPANQPARTGVAEQEQGESANDADGSAASEAVEGKESGSEGSEKGEGAEG